MTAAMGASLETVIIRTARMYDLAAWYADVLELGEWERFPSHVGQRVGPIYLGFDQVEGGAGGGPSGGGGSRGYGGADCWFHLDDLERTFERAVESGAEVVDSPSDKPFGYRLACVLDPDGNRVEVIAWA